METKDKKWKKDRDRRQLEQELKKRRNILLSCVLFDKAQTPSLISTQEISLGRRWGDKRPKKAFVDGKRKRKRQKGRKIENGGGAEE